MNYVKINILDIRKSTNKLDCGKLTFRIGKGFWCYPAAVFYCIENDCFAFCPGAKVAVNGNFLLPYSYEIDFDNSHKK